MERATNCFPLFFYLTISRDNEAIPLLLRRQQKISSGPKQNVPVVRASTRQTVWLYTCKMHAWARKSHPKNSFLELPAEKVSRNFAFSVSVLRNNRSTGFHLSLYNTARTYAFRSSHVRRVFRVVFPSSPVASQLRVLVTPCYLQYQYLYLSDKA